MSLIFEAVSAAEHHPAISVQANLRKQVMPELKRPKRMMRGAPV